MICPHCESDLKGDPIPDKHFEHGDDHDEQVERWGHCFCFSYGWREPKDRFFGREILVEIPQVYDGGLFFMCPDCRGRWHRWPEGSPLHEDAVPYVNGEKW